jgi:hypothetical protein
MSDLEDRGAYTPFSREQLAFDPRDTRRRRPVPLTLMASAVVLVALGGVALMFYQSGVRGRNEPPRAIGTPVGSIKTPPAASDAKPVDPNAPASGALDVYVQDRSEPGAAQPVYTPAPEQPAPRTAEAQPAPQTVAQAAPRVASPPPPAKAAPAYPSIEAAADAAETAPPAPLKPAKVATPKPTAFAAAQPAKPKPDAKAAPVKVAAADKAATDKAATAGGSGAVQIGAYSSKALADQEFAKVKASFAKFTSGRGTHVEPVQKGAATLYRAAFTGFSKTQATAFCGALKAAGRACIVK